MVRLADRPVDRLTSRRMNEWVAVGFAAFIVAGLGVYGVPSARHIDDVTITNPSPYRMYVMASETDGGGLSSVGVVPPRSTVRLDGVLDRGRTWSLHLITSEGFTQTMIIGRSELVGTDGVVIPTHIEEQFRAAGARPDTLLGRENAP